MSAASALLDAVQLWGWTGATVALVFLTIGIDRIEDDAQGAYVFRDLQIPGIIVIWPLVLWRWYVYETKTEAWPKRYAPPRKSHFAVGLIMPVGIALIIAAGLMARQTCPADVAPVQLSQPAAVTE